MSEHNKIYEAKSVGHKVPKKKREKVNIVLKNTIGPEESIKKVKIPVDTPIHKLKAKIGELYGLDPNDFQLNHIPSKGKNSENDPAQINITTKKSKAPVRIILRDRTGQKKFQKKLSIPDDISIGELRNEVAKKFNMNSDEFNLSLEKYL